MNWIKTRIQRNKFRFNKNANGLKVFFLYEKAEPVIESMPLHNSHYTVAPMNHALIKQHYTINTDAYRYFMRYLNAGDSGLAILFQGKIIGYGWLSINNETHKKLVNHVFRQPPNSGYIYSCYTNSEHRGKGLYKYLINKLTKIAFQANIRKLYIDTSKTNVTAMRGITTSGFTFTGRIYKLVIFGFRILLWRNHE